MDPLSVIWVSPFWGAVFFGLYMIAVALAVFSPFLLLWGIVAGICALLRRR